MVSDTKRFDPVELADLKARTELSSLFASFGVRSKGSASARWANCCFHGEKTPSLKIDDKRGRYYCFGCGAAGDHFTVLAELGGKSFMESVETLGGVRLITAEERKAVAERSKKWEDEDKKERERARKSCERLFSNAAPILGTHGEAYLSGRGLPVVKRWVEDIRFLKELAYRGFVDENADETTELGAFPAMVAAIRNAQGEIIGLHRTYLDPVEPVKLTPPGCQRRNKAKKVLGEQSGGLIRLSPMGPRLAVGEGIETSQSWFALGLGGNDIAIAAAVSIGNMAGGATGSSPHPKDSKKRIPNGVPDLDRPGMILPPQVKEIILIGDGDSDPAMTRARLVVAGRRFRKQGVAVSVCMAPQGNDFNDVLQSDAGSD
jgi:hypothetical protein